MFQLNQSLNDEMVVRGCQVCKIKLHWEVSPDNEVEKIPHQSSPNLSQIILRKISYELIALRLNPMGS